MNELEKQELTQEEKQKQLEERQLKEQIRKTKDRADTLDTFNMVLFVFICAATIIYESYYLTSLFDINEEIFGSRWFSAGGGLILTNMLWGLVYLSFGLVIFALSKGVVCILQNQVIILKKNR